MNKKFLLIIEVDDELPDIYEKLKAIKDKEITMFVPRQSILFQSLINLKILKRKVESLKKDVTINTTDKQNIVLVEKAGFVVQHEKESEEKEPLDKNQRKRIKEHSGKTSLWDTMKQRIRKIENTKPERPLVFSPPNRKPLFTFIIISLLLFFFILYIALPSATIYIKPTLKIQKSSLNIEMVLKENMGQLLSEDDRMIPLYTSTVTYERTIKLTPSGKNFKGTFSTGVVTLFNSTKDDWPIVGNSRIQTNDGLVFLTKYFVTVPSGSADNPGKTTVQVVARDKDVNGLFIGARGNIAPTRFILPGLSQYNQAMLYAESFEPFGGGTDAFEYYVTKFDLDMAEQKIQAELDVSAVAELKKAVAEKNTNASNMKLFDRSEKMIIKQTPEFTIRARENDITDNFETWGKMTATGYYYDEKEIERILTNNLIITHLSPTEKILKIKNDSLQIDEVLEAKQETGKIKVNTSLEGIVAYDFLNNNADLVQKIRDTLVGKTKKEADMYLNNLREISEATISLWPLWSPALPSLPENIKIQVME